MLAIFALLAGLIFGWMRAKKRGGTRADCVQYALAHGLAFGLAGLAAAIILVRIF